MATVKYSNWCGIFQVNAIKYDFNVILFPYRAMSEALVTGPILAKIVSPIQIDSNGSKFEKIVCLSGQESWTHFNQLRHFVASDDLKLLVWPGKAT